MKTEYKNLDELFDDIVVEIHGRQPLLFTEEVLRSVLDELFHCNTEFNLAKGMKAPYNEMILNQDGSGVGYREVQRDIYEIPLSAEPIFAVYKMALDCPTIMEILNLDAFSELVEEFHKCSDVFFKMRHDASTSRTVSGMLDILDLFNNIKIFNRSLNG